MLHRTIKSAEPVALTREDSRIVGGGGKRWHKHHHEGQVLYIFITLTHLVDDFWQAVEDWRPA
jgi:hypothetical protein